MAEEVEAVRHLQRLRRAACGARSLVTAAVPAHDLHARRRVQPGGDGVSGTRRQEIDDPVLLKVDNQRPRGPACAEGNVIHRADRRRGARRDGEGADLPQQGLPTDGATAVPEEASARDTTEGKGPLREPGGETIGAARVRCCDRGDPFGEEALFTGAVVAEAAVRLQTHLHGQAIPGEVSQRPLLAARGSVGGLAAARAGRFRGVGADDHRAGRIGGRQTHEAELSGLRDTSGRHRWGPWFVRDRVSVDASHGVPRNPSMRHHQKGARAALVDTGALGGEVLKEVFPMSKHVPTCPPEFRTEAIRLAGTSGRPPCANGDDR